MKLKQMFFMLVCFGGFAGIFYYTLVRSGSFNGRPASLDIKGVVALTGFLSISQHQLNSKTSHSRQNLHIIRVNFSSRNHQPNVYKTKMKLTNASTVSSDDSWENLELYAIPKPSNDKRRRRLKNDEELDEKFLRNDERSIERIVNGLATDSSEEMPDVFRKQGLPKKRFANVLIIGVKKAGTRALLEMIKLHPQVCACGPEIHYFDRYYDKGLQWYRDRMPLCYENEIIMEKTPSYFVTNGVAKDIFEYSKQLNKTLKLIVIVRDPTKRAISDYTQTQSNNFKTTGFRRTFEEMALRSGTDDRVEVNARWGAIKIGVYSKHLKRWQRYFTSKQIHVVSGETLIKQPFDEIRKVEEFLQLPSFIKPEHFVYNETKGFYCLDRKMNKAVSDNSTNEIISTPMKCLGRTKGRSHVKVSNNTERLLRDYYRPFNQELYDLIGRNFGWP